MLHYYRCHDCCSTFTYSDKGLDAKCICGGILIYLGKVEHHRVIGTTETVPCDGRCTGATGPMCDCSCNGENHGSNKLVTVEYDNGAAVVRPPDASAIENGKAYREAKQDIYDTLAAVFGNEFEAKRKGNWIANKEHWYAMDNAMSAVWKIQALKAHKNRIAKLAALK